MATLGSLSEGSIVKIKRNGNFQEFYVAKHDYESGLNGAGRTLLVAKNNFTCSWSSGGTPGASGNTYDISNIDAYLNGTYKNSFEADALSCIGETKFYYLKYRSDTSLSTLSRSFFLLSASELGSNNNSLEDGTAIPIASQLISSEYQTLYTRSVGDTSSYGASSVIVIGYEEGDYNDYQTYGYCLDPRSKKDCRAAFTLPSSLTVNSDGTFIFNTAPTVTSETPSGTELGEIAEGFDFKYTVNDADGDAVTVTEYLDDVAMRSFAVTLGSEYTFECVNPENWQKILNGSHTVKVVANDGTADSPVYSVSFTKNVTTATISLKTPLPADDVITVMALAISGEIPEDAGLEVLVTNNANDSSPVWEDATIDVRKKNNYVFSNQTAENGFAFNFKVTVSRGESNTGGFITSIGGAFE